MKSLQESMQSAGPMSLGITATCTLLLTGSALGGVMETQPPAGAPVTGLSGDELTTFEVGKIGFTHSFTAAEGLGPIFNKESCGNCHANPVGGPGSQVVLRAGQLTKGGFDALEELGGSLFQIAAISEDCLEVVPDLPDIITSDRLTNGMMGYGLVESIPDADIEALEDPDDLDKDGISGRVHWVPAFEDGDLHVGKFGWKAQDPTLFTFTVGGLLNEVGLTSSFLMDENDPNGIDPPTIEECDAVADPEVTDQHIDDVTDFQRFLAAPPQTPQSGMTGEQIFLNIGCGDCHTPSFTTADEETLEDALRNKVVKPYADFLLHDVGAGADFIPQGDATDLEIRTTPLMGLRSRDPMWHDGRFGGDTFENRVTLAILEHGAFGSEARAAGVVNPNPDVKAGETLGTYDQLSPEDKALLVQFLDSLGRREFDSQENLPGESIIDEEDFADFVMCSLPNGAISPDDPCAIHDIDQDGDVDLDDLEAFMTVYTGFQGDCDDNGTNDLIDIFTNPSLDADQDGVLDSCQVCPADFSGNGSVDFADLLILLDSWGPCAACLEDLDGNGEVGFADLLMLLNDWGPCPKR